MKIFFVNNLGGGFADHIEVEAGATVEQLFQLRMRNEKPGDFRIRCNRQVCPSDQVLQEGDHVSFTPVKIEGPTPGRLMVVGDSDWMSPELLDNPQLSNIDLLSSTAGWLTQREALINIAPRKTNARAVIMSDADLQNLLFRVVVMLPLAAFIAGFGVWWSRRS